MKPKDEYEALVEDLKPTRTEIRKAINKEIKDNPAATRTVKGLEIDVLARPGWAEVLVKDAAILYDYGKYGWKVMWYQIHSQGPGEGDLLRSWISIRDLKYMSKENRYK